MEVRASSRILTRQIAREGTAEDGMVVVVVVVVVVGMLRKMLATLDIEVFLYFPV